LIVLQIFSTQNIQQKTVVKSIIELNSRVQDTLIQKKEVQINTQEKTYQKPSKAGIILLVSGILLLLLGLVIEVPRGLIKPFFILGIVLMTGVLDSPKNSSVVKQQPNYTQDTIKRWLKKDTLTPHELAYQKLKKEQTFWHNATDRAAIKKQNQKEDAQKERAKIAQQGKDYTFDQLALTFLWTFLGVFSVLFCGFFVYTFFSQGYLQLLKAGLCLLLGIFFFLRMIQSWRKAKTSIEIRKILEA
jgi:hypothetical protein